MSKPSKACLTELPRSGSGLNRATEVLGNLGACIGLAVTMNDVLLAGKCHVIRRNPRPIYMKPDLWKRIRAQRIESVVLGDLNVPIAETYWLEKPKENET